MAISDASPGDLRSRPGGRWWALAAFVAAVAATAVIGGLGVSGAATEYNGLDRPAWAPPAAVFGPVWTVLYAMIALAGWLAWQRVGLTAALWPYVVQLVLNASWTPLFFGAGQYGLALVDIVALWLAVGVTVVVFWRVRRAAALLLLPYWAWVSYAAALNLAIWRLN
jgi:tryptophan-rich sensory protein